MFGDEEILSESLRPPAYIVETGSVWNFLLFLLLFLLLCGSLVWLFLKLKKKKRAPVSKKQRTSFEIVFCDLKKARKKISEKTFNEFAIAVSQAIRNYIKREFKIPTDCITTEEFIDSFMKVYEMDWKTVSLVGDLLKLADMTKFAKRALLERQQKLIYLKACKFVRVIESMKRREAYEKIQKQILELTKKDIK